MFLFLVVCIFTLIQNVGSIQIKGFSLKQLNNTKEFPKVFQINFQINNQTSKKRGVYSGMHEKHNMCSSWWSHCNSANGWYAWCEGIFSHHCCFKSRSPPYGQNCKGTSQECVYVCCSPPQMPCGYGCCNPAPPPTPPPIPPPPIPNPPPPIPSPNPGPNPYPPPPNPETPTPSSGPSKGVLQDVINFCRNQYWIFIVAGVVFCIIQGISYFGFDRFWCCCCHYRGYDGCQASCSCLNDNSCCFCFNGGYSNI